ncbi:hypothetical protein ACQPZU_19395 [Saccharomonospora azurea]|uniref:hypothetical protein n=1 Tax=Saccharomonospora azurea TaxID=40988 RepID=UPI003D8E3B11
MKDDRTKVENTDSQQSEKSEKSGLSPVQVAAAALAAVTAAFLCSTLGVYGTVVGAGLLSVVTTVGSELFMRSLERTKNAARVVAGRRKREAAHQDLDRTVYLPAVTQQRWDEHAAAMERTRVLASPGPVENSRARRQWWRRRGPVLAATSALAFVIGMLVVTGYEGVTGKALSGDGSTTVSSIVRGDGQVGGDRTPPEVNDPDGEREDTDGSTSTSAPEEEPDERRGGGAVEETPSETPRENEPSQPAQPSQPTQPSETTSVPQEPSDQQPAPTTEAQEERAPSDREN